MTRKEVIDRLDIIVSKHEVDDVYITLTNEKDYEALKVAINSLRIDEQYELEYEQAEPCDDAISRKAVFDLFKTFWRCFASHADEEIFKKEIVALTSVKPQEPKTDVLDKIRAEILKLDDVEYDFEGYYKAVTDALQIIDKYKAESEDKE